MHQEVSVPSAGESLREVMRVYPQGVAVVTAVSPEEGPRGITVSSFISLSLDPPLVLISIIRSAQAHDAIEKAGTFAVNVLGEDQGGLSEHFATPGLSSEEQFRPVAHRAGKTRSPLLTDCLAYLDCQLVEAIMRADHTLFIGEVGECKVLRDVRPLVFFSRQYWRLGAEVHRRV